MEFINRIPSISTEHCEFFQRLCQEVRQKAWLMVGFNLWPSSLKPNRRDLEAEETRKLGSCKYKPAPKIAPQSQTLKTAFSFFSTNNSKVMLLSNRSDTRF